MEIVSSEVWTVSRLTSEVARLIDGGLPFLWVEGEISDYKVHASSGNRYFQLKDDESQIACVFWRSRPSPDFAPQDGMLVRVFGKVTTYMPRSQYQFDVMQMIPVGRGSLQEAFEMLKRKLQAEGLFDLARKRPLPQFPRSIGLITSSSGAAIHDFIWTFLTRYPPVKLYLIPVAVQGEGAAAEIAHAIDLYNQLGLVDLIVVGRGGGSLEDLWAFNEEVVVRAVAGSGIPVVSAVGHEVDVTLCDLAADLRAPTPATAGNVVVPDRRELLVTLTNLQKRISGSLFRTLEIWRERLETLKRSYGFFKLKHRVSEERRRLDESSDRLREVMSRMLEKRRNWVELQRQRLQALSPFAVLERGYCVVRKEDRSLVSTAAQLVIGERLWLQFSHNHAQVTVDGISDQPYEINKEALN